MTEATRNISDPIVIAAAARTPMAAFQGDFATLTAPQLGAAAIEAALARSGLKPEQIDEVLMGCVLPSGIGQAPAPQAALRAGLPLSAGCPTVNTTRGSRMRAAIFPP